MLSSEIEDSSAATTEQSLSLLESPKMSTPSVELSTSELQSLERERVFDAFRRWGYLDAGLNPFGGPIGGGFPEVRASHIKGAAAAEARRIYCGSIGAEFMHLPQQDRREG